MQEHIDQMLEVVRGAWRFRWPGLALASGLAVAGWLVIFALPDSYEANARVFVDTRTALKPVLQGLAVEQDVNAQLNFVRQSLLAGPQLKKIAEESGVLPLATVAGAKQTSILQDMTERIILTVHSASDREDERSTAGSIYGIAFQDNNRDRALKVVQTLLNTLVEETLGGKRAGSQNAQKFLGEQIKEYEQRLRAAEDRLAAFKKRNVGLMPTEQGGYFAQLQAELDAVKKAETDLSVAVSRHSTLEKQLRGETAISATSAAPATAGNVGGSGDTVSRIRETQARLDDLLLRFTDRHPDVIAARATLEALQQRRQLEIAQLRRGDPNAVAASGASNNPVYQSIQLALNQSDVEISTLRGQLGQHQEKAAELKRRLDTAPQVEAEYAQLDRDYGVNKAQYTALLASYEKARLGEQADDAGSVRFEIVQPPNADFIPVAPKRSLLIVGVLLGAFAAGCGLAYLLNVLRPVISSAHTLRKITGMPVLGAVGAAFPEQVHASARRSYLQFAAGAAGLLAGFALALGLNWAGVRLSLSALGLVRT